MHFDPNWEKQQYDFEDGVCIIRASSEVLDKMAEMAEEDEGDARFSVDARYAVQRYTKWLLVTDSFAQADRVVSGPNMSNMLQDEYVRSFMVALNVVKSTAVIAPLVFVADVDKRDDEVRPVKVVGCRNRSSGGDYEPREIAWQETPQEADHLLLQDVWAGVAKARQLRRWANWVLQEETFAEFDKAASAELAKKEEEYHRWKAVLENIDSLPEIKAKFVEELGPNFREEIMADLENQRKGTDPGRFYEAVGKRREEYTYDHTKLGRAISLLDQGLYLPPMHALISMCVVVETLYTTDDGELTHKLCTRLAKTLKPKGSFEERQEYYKRARAVYRARSKLVHGEKAIDEIAESVQRDAVVLARESLQHIMADEKLFSYFTGREDKQGKKLGDFFDRLDLSG
jgi:hypothetical protein